jgi:hypothetical protein
MDSKNSWTQIGPGLALGTVCLVLALGRMARKLRLVVHCPSENRA